MSDFDLHSQKGSSQSQGSTSSQDLKDQVADAGAEVRQRAGDALRPSTDVARDKFEEAADAARDVVEEASDRFQDEAEKQQRFGADFVRRLSGNIRDAARACQVTHLSFKHLRPQPVIR